MTEQNTMRLAVFLPLCAFFTYALVHNWDRTGEPELQIIPGVLLIFCIGGLIDPPK